jgi:hypothetical protein
MPADDIDLTQFESDAAMPPVACEGDWPTLNDWTAISYGADICLEGRVHGHPRLPDGGEIRTSAVSRIAKDRTWAKTRNTFYALGVPAPRAAAEHIPDVLQLICSPDWDAALALLAAWTKPRADELSPAMDSLRRLLPWSERRAIVAVIRRELSANGQHRLGDIWSIIATDPDEWSSCRLAANTVGAAFKEWSAFRGGVDDATGRRMRRIVNGWWAMAKGRSGKLMSTTQQDPVALAHSLGEDLAQCEDDLIKEDGNEREGKLLDKLRQDPPPVQPEPVGPGLIVIAKIGGNAKDWRNRPTCEEFRPLVGKPIPLVETPDLAQARATLAAEFPHAAAQIDILLSDLVGRHTVKLRPTLLVSAAGGLGKSRLAHRVAAVLGLQFSGCDASGSNDSSFAGCARHWSTAEPCAPLAAVLSTGTANPLLLIDEIDKASRSSNNGGLAQALLPFLEKNETASRYNDIYLQAPVDLSGINYLLTANDELLLPKVLRDRLRILRVPAPTVAHLPALARTIVREIAVERGVDAAWAAPLDGDELHIAAGLWPGGSIRRLRAIIECLLARRDEQAQRH